MRDKRPVDELSIEELERILAIRKREARQARMRRYEETGRRVATPPEAQVSSDSDEIEVVPVQVSKTPLKPAKADPIELDDEEEIPAPPPKRKAMIAADPDPRFEDELDQSRKNDTGGGPTLRTRVWNRALLGVEILATVGLIALAVALLQSLQEITQVSANIQAQNQATIEAQRVEPTATPLIDVTPVVLPVGHTVTVSDTGQVSATFNLDEVPAQYRAQYQAMISQPVIEPTSSPEGPVRVRIPAIGVDKPVVSGDTWAALQLGVGYHIGSANPGQKGNVVLSAHNDVFGEIFRRLDELKPGDQVTVSTMSRDYTYQITSSTIVSPTDVYVMQSRGDEKQLTLISCYPYRVDSKRYIVFATLVS